MKLLLVDDHAIVRAGLKRLLAVLPGVELREAANGRDALTMFREEHPDVVLLDINLPGIGGLELLRRLVLENRDARVLVFSMHSEVIYARQCLQAGAVGYISKGAPPDEIIEAVRQVAKGQRYIERQIAQELALRVVEGGPAATEKEPDLTARDIELLRLLSQGRSLAEMANEIGVSYKTVANTISLIKTKLGVSRTADLMRIAIKTGISS
jgi:DNA-binding NarL/FixJ family response regulator